MTDKNVDLQGQNANKNGKWLENQVEAELAKYGIGSIKSKDIGTKEGKAFIASCKHGFLAKNVPYTNMFGSNAYGEFVLHLFGVGTFRIECRYQKVSGSAQDKLPKLLGDCICMKEPNAIIVVEGDGITDNARNWIKASAKAVQHKKIRVKTLNEFNAWVKNILTKTIKVSAPSPANSLVKSALDTKFVKKDTKTFTKN